MTAVHARRENSQTIHGYTFQHTVSSLDCAKLMGHAQPGTTYRHYDRPSTEQLIHAVRERGR